VALSNAYSDLTTATEFRLYIVSPDDNGQFESVGLTQGFFNVNGSTSPVPEPGTCTLLVSGGLALLFVLGRRKPIRA
jgi:hypothetical protein